MRSRLTERSTLPQCAVDYLFCKREEEFRWSQAPHSRSSDHQRAPFSNASPSRWYGFQGGTASGGSSAGGQSSVGEVSRYFAEEQMWGLFFTSLAFCYGFATNQKLAQYSGMVSAATFSFLCLLSFVSLPPQIQLTPSHICHFFWEAFPDHPRMGSLTSCTSLLIIVLKYQQVFTEHLFCARFVLGKRHGTGQTLSASMAWTF